VSEPGEALDIERLVAELEEIQDPVAREKVRALVRGILALHAGCLERIVSTLASEAPALLATLVSDDLVASVLLLHELHPEPLAERVTRALTDARARLAALGATIARVEISEGLVAVAVDVADDAHAGAAANARAIVEQALASAAPDADIEVTAPDDPAIVPVGRLKSPRTARGGSR
jgi:hypothetical protein